MVINFVTPELSSCVYLTTYALWILFRRCVIQNIKAIKFLVLVIAAEF